MKRFLAICMLIAALSVSCGGESSIDETLLDLRGEVRGSGQNSALWIDCQAEGPVDVVVKVQTPGGAWLEWQDGMQRVSSFPIKVEGQGGGSVEVPLEEELYQQVWHEESLLDERFSNGELSLQDYYYANWDLLGLLLSEHDYSYGKYTVVVEDSSGKLVQTSEVEYSWSGRGYVKLVSASPGPNPQRLEFYMYGGDTADIQVMANHGTCVWQIVDDLGQLYRNGWTDSYERGGHTYESDANVEKHFWLEVDAGAPDDDWLIEIWGWQ